jgi:hypothetical protein
LLVLPGIIVYKLDDFASSQGVQNEEEFDMYIEEAMTLAEGRGNATVTTSGQCLRVHEVK